MPPRRVTAMTGYADEARQSGVAGLDRSAKGAVRAHRDLPLRSIDEVVELDQVHVVDP